MPDGSEFTPDSSIPLVPLSLYILLSSDEIQSLKRTFKKCTVYKEEIA